jgi:hypothetical protein
MKRELVIELFNGFTGCTYQQKLNDAFGKASILIKWKSLTFFPFIKSLSLFLEHFTLKVPVSLIN